MQNLDTDLHGFYPFLTLSPFSSYFHGPENHDSKLLFQEIPFDTSYLYSGLPYRLVGELHRELDCVVSSPDVGNNTNTLTGSQITTVRGAVKSFSASYLPSQIHSPVSRASPVPQIILLLIIHTASLRQRTGLHGYEGTERVRNFALDFLATCSWVSEYRQISEPKTVYESRHYIC